MSGWAEARDLWPHVTWSARWDMIYYWLRRLVVAPAPGPERCIMGGTLGDVVWCPRRAVDGGLWCSRHMPEGEGNESSGH